jgi:hypothetical protein
MYDYSYGRSGYPPFLKKARIAQSQGYETLGLIERFLLRHISILGLKPKLSPNGVNLKKFIFTFGAFGVLYGICLRCALPKCGMRDLYINYFKLTPLGSNLGLKINLL